MRRDVSEKSIGPGAVLAGRFRLEDLVQDTAGAKFWRATDLTLVRNVAVNVIGADDPRADALLLAARTSATVADGHFLRVLDAAVEDGVVYVVNEWGSGVSLDRMLSDGPLPARRAAWLVKEVAEAITTAHRSGIAHGRLLPENVMVTEAGSVKLIGFVVDAVLNGGRETDIEVGSEPVSDHASDVVNLASLLYVSLVGRWPGSAGSSVPEAPRESGRVLRPRQVRAGVPRPLDAICERVLNAGAHDHIAIESAHEIRSALSDFIGDPSATAMEPEPTTVIPSQALGWTPGSGQTSDDPEQTAQFPAGLSTTAAAATPTGAHEAPEPQESVQSPQSSEPADPDATQLGAPLFFNDDSGIGWMNPERTRGLRSDEEPAHRAPPLPALSDPEPRPLFAPDPPAGRATTSQPSGQPSSQPPSQPPSQPGNASRHGTGSIPALWGPDSGVPDEVDDTGGWQSRDAGKNWLKLAAIVAVCIVLAVAIIIAFNLGRGSGGPGDTTDPNPSDGPSTNRAAGPLSIAGVSDFDPEGDPPEENSELAGLAVDGDPATAWKTMTYFNDPELGGLKDGVGLLVDLGKPVEVSQVELTLIGGPTSLDILAAKEGASAPTSTDGLDEVASVDGAGTNVDPKFEAPVTTRYLVVWLTSLPPTSGGFAGQIAEIVVRP